MASLQVKFPERFKTCLLSLLAGFWKLFWIICIACWRWCAKVSWTLFN
jgi:hypothetical protein